VATDHGVRPHNQTIKSNKDQPIHGTKGQFLGLVASLDTKLMTKDQDLSFRERNNETSTSQTML
jgi:hypothetical protein